MALRARKRLLAEPVLARPDGPPARPDGPAPGQPPQGRGRDVLEFHRDRLGPLGEGPQRGQVVGGADDRPVGHLGGGGVLGRAQDPRPVAHPLRGLDEHASELTAADHPQRCGRMKDVGDRPIPGR